MFTWPTWGNTALWVIVPLGIVLSILLLYLDRAKRAEADRRRKDAEYERQLWGEEDTR